MNQTLYAQMNNKRKRKKKERKKERKTTSSARIQEINLAGTE
jgi:hypothetical protein